MFVMLFEGNNFTLFCSLINTYKGLVSSVLSSELWKLYMKSLSILDCSIIKGRWRTTRAGQFCLVISDYNAAAAVIILSFYLLLLLIKVQGVSSRPHIGPQCRGS